VRQSAENRVGALPRGLGRDAGGCWGAWLREMEMGVGAAARMAGGAHGGGGWGGTRGRLRAWPGAAARMAAGLGRDAGAAARMAGCPWRRVRVRERGNRTVSDGGEVDNRTIEMEAGAWLC
jgi:hypothetical protein